MLSIKEHGLSAISETCYYSDSWIYSYINEYFYLLFNLTGDESSFFLSWSAGPALLCFCITSHNRFPMWLTAKILMGKIFQE